MARYSKIVLGPARKNDPQVREAPAAAKTLPGCLVALVDGEFALATATTAGRVWLAQENYLAQRGVEAAYEADDRLIGLEMQPDVLYAGRIPDGVDVADGAALTLGANGLFALAAANARIVAYADEAFDNDTGETALIRVRPA